MTALDTQPIHISFEAGLQLIKDGHVIIKTNRPGVKGDAEFHIGNRGRCTPLTGTKLLRFCRPVGDSLFPEIKRLSQTFEYKRKD
jgi:hypothetical protein